MDISTFDWLKQSFKVNDLLNKQTKVIFVLESPHKDELKYGLPVSGRAGGTMTKKLFDDKTPLGRFLNDSWKHNDHLSYGIMNMCPIPMQRSAYGETGEQEDLDYFFTIMEKVRTSQTKGPFKKPDMNDLRGIVLEDFQGRINQFIGQKMLFIPCGKFANINFNKLNLDNNWEVLWRVPHPSYNSWYRSENLSLMSHLHNNIRKFVDE